MKTILITGAGGQLGSAIKTVAGNFSVFRFIYIDIQDLDLTDDTKVQQYFKENPVDFIINCAAYTAVDKAEEQQDEAFQINGHVPELLGKICASTDTCLFHISTDFVYDGRRNIPHVEEEIPLPHSVYAMSKLEGEKKLWDNPHAMIIRTSWLYSEFGNNFMKTMIRLMKEKQELGIVFDQAGTPTYAFDLALAILKIAEHSVQNGFIPGIYNYSNEGVCSWFDFAMAIKEINQSTCSLKPIRTNEYPLPAKRPEYSVMDKSKIKRTFGITIPYWRDSLMVAMQQFRNKTF